MLGEITSCMLDLISTAYTLCNRKEVCNANEANITVWVSRLGKQTSATQLKRKTNRSRNTDRFSDPKPDCISLNVDLLPLCTVVMRGLLLTLIKSLKRQNSFMLAYGQMFFSSHLIKLIYLMTCIK